VSEVFDVIVIGGGQAGLASGYHLKKKGLRFLILEANDQAVGSWPKYYDSLKLFSPTRFSSMPGMKFPGDPDRYPARDEVLAVLRPVKLIKQRTWGLDLHFWVRVTGVDTFPFWRFGKIAPSSTSVIDLGQYAERLAAGKPDQKSMFTSFYNEGVIWPDGTKEPVDTVIFATGYRPNLAYLSNIGALDSNGEPLQVAGISTSFPGIYYVGLNGQRSIASATLRGVGPDAKFVVKRLLRHLKINRSKS
jgi:cation diffusion facilitator CzcD-associated flavoprotein CzcO